MAKTWRVLVFEPGKPAELRDIPDTLEALQEIVGGYIEVLHPSKAGLQGIDRTLMVFNEEGRLMGLPKNRFGIVGSLVFVGNQAPDFRSLTSAEIELIRKMGDQPAH